MAIKKRNIIYVTSRIKNHFGYLTMTPHTARKRGKKTLKRRQTNKRAKEWIHKFTREWKTIAQKCFSFRYFCSRRQFLSIFFVANLIRLSAIFWFLTFESAKPKNVENESKNIKKNQSTATKQKEKLFFTVKETKEKQLTFFFASGKVQTRRFEIKCA